MRPHVCQNSSEGSIGNHRDSRIPETWRELLRPRGAEEESTGLGRREALGARDENSQRGREPWGREETSRSTAGEHSERAEEHSKEQRSRAQRTQEDGRRPKRTAEELGSTAGEQEEHTRRAERHSRTT